MDKTTTNTNPPKVFFIVSAPRSGSTMLARICGSGSNCLCEVEPFTELVNRPDQLMLKIRQHIESHYIEVYGQKDPEYCTLIPRLYKEFKCKFIYPVRETAKAGKSLYNWQRYFTGGIRTTSIRDAVKLCRNYNRQIREALTKLPPETYSMVPLNHWCVLDIIRGTLDWLGIEHDGQTVCALFNARINSPKERGFI